MRCEKRTLWMLLGISCTPVVFISYLFLCSDILGSRAPDAPALRIVLAGLFTLSCAATLSVLLARRMTVLKDAAAQAEARMENAQYGCLLAGMPVDCALPVPSPGGFVAVVMHFPPQSHEESGIQETPPSIRQCVDRYVMPVFSACAFAKCVDIQPGRMALIVSLPDEADVTALLEDALRKARSELGIAPAAAVGGRVARIEDISESFRQAERRLARPADRPPAHFPLEQEQALLAALVQGREDVCFTILHGVIEANRQRSGFDPAGLSLMLAACVQRALDALAQSEADVFGGDSDLHLALGLAQGYDALRETALSIFGRLSECFAQARIGSAPLERMLAFVEQNYARDISLLDLAEHMGLSKNYVSMLFRNEAGQNFKEYISRLRYQRACALLMENRRIKITDVAAQVGCSMDSLQRLFQRYGGASPQAFSRAQRGKGPSLPG